MKTSFLRTRIFWIFGLIITGMLMMGYRFAPPSRSPVVIAQSAIANEITVYRSPSCNCCGRWVDHMQAAGFQIEDYITEEIEAIKAQHGLSEELSSCHTAIVDGYVVEGHVPAADVQRLLAEQPPVVGIAAPGMPVGSPGMEMGDTEPYTVVSFTADGTVEVFAEHS